MNNGLPMTPGGWGVLIVFILSCAVVLAILLLLRMEPSRWPAPLQHAWAMLPQPWHIRLTRIAASAVTWFILGLVLGSAFLNPLARWLRSVMP